MFSKLKNISNKDHLRIIITDSGLGGLSVHALLDKFLKEQKLARSVDLIFYNSLIDHGNGYNSMSTIQEKAEVFDRALSGMMEYLPDLILIACNTLSVIYPFTKFSKQSHIPTVGIVEIGVNQILEILHSEDDSKILIFGTPTTVQSNEHKTKLISKGVSDKNIFYQECRDLESEIQLNPSSSMVHSMIDQYCNEIASQINIADKVISLLACTHYGYCYSDFYDKLDTIFKNRVTLLNPNFAMAKNVEKNLEYSSEGNSDITNKVVSRVNIFEEEINSLGKLIKSDSPSVTNALENHIYNPNLF